MTSKFYFPLAVRKFKCNQFGRIITNSECILNGKYAARHGRAIMDKFYNCISKDTENMAFHFGSAKKFTIESMDWGMEYKNGELFGFVNIVHEKPFAKNSILLIKDFIEDQNAFGIGRDFERQKIEIDEGVLKVKFWNCSEDYFVDTENELMERIQNEEEIKPFNMGVI